jgi:hypothetical protein
MAFLQTQDLLPALEQHLSRAERIDIAVAWAWSCRAISLLQEAAQGKRQVKIRAIVGTGGNGTQPAALRSLADFADLRIQTPKSIRELFHPKVFLFDTGGKSVVWVGSANLTSGGFLNNVEGVFESSQGNDVRVWFDELWNSLPTDPMPAIVEYEAKWVPPSLPTSLPPEPGKTSRKLAELPVLENGAPETWLEFVKHVDSASTFWAQWAAKHEVDFSVLGDTRSWVETIQTGQLLTRRRSWLTFTDNEVRILLGLNDQVGAWGLLGSMRGAGFGKQVFFARSPASHKDLKQIQDAVRSLEFSSGWSETVDAATAALDRICAVHGVSTAIATRLLALSRPDVCVSVNRGSAPRMAAAMGLGLNETTIRQPKNYRAVLEWVGQQPWYRSPRPSASREATLWDMRAALLDTFFYEPL